MMNTLNQGNRTVNGKLITICEHDKTYIEFVCGIEDRKGRLHKKVTRNLVEFIDYANQYDWTIKVVLMRKPSAQIRFEQQRKEIALAANESPAGYVR